MSAEHRNIPDGTEVAVVAGPRTGDPSHTPLLLVFEGRRIIIKEELTVYRHEDEGYVVYDLPENAYQLLRQALERHIALIPEERPLIASGPTVMTIVSKNGLREFHETDLPDNDSRRLAKRVRELLDEEGLQGQRQEGHGIDPSAFNYRR